MNPTAEQGNTTEQTPDGVVGGTFRLDAMSPGAGDAAAADAVQAPRKSWKSTQTIALVVLLAAGGGIVYGMRQAGIGPMAAFATTKMPDYDVTKAPGSKTADHQRILKDLAATNITGQVPADKVQKNPFLLADLLGGPPGRAEPDDDGWDEVTSRIELDGDLFKVVLIWKVKQENKEPENANSAQMENK